MVKLVSGEGRWATKDNAMIFSNVVWCGNIEDAKMYHLIDENKNDIPFNLKECIVEENLPF